MSVLITGAAGSLAALVTQRLEGGEPLIGVDLRPMRAERPFPGEYVQLNRYSSRRMADVFRRHKPRLVIHLGVRAGFQRSMQDRYTNNVLGTRHLLQLCERYPVQRVVALSTYHVYGAHQHNAVGIREDAPLRASQIFPELADAVELDHTLTTFMWRQRQVSTIVLRPCNVVGPTLNNQITRLLRSQRSPRLLGFDPMLQFMHEDDAARAIALACQSNRWGVYNVAGEGTIPYEEAIRRAGGRPVPIPSLPAYIAVSLLWRLRLIFPQHLMDYFRYPTVIDDSAFRKELGFEPLHNTLDTLASLRLSPPRRG